MMTVVTAAGVEAAGPGPGELESAVTDCPLPEESSPQASKPSPARTASERESVLVMVFRPWVVEAQLAVVLLRALRTGGASTLLGFEAVPPGRKREPAV
jgi:hypothetical protein